MPVRAGHGRGSAPVVRTHPGLTPPAAGSWSARKTGRLAATASGWRPWRRGYARIA